MYLLGDFLGIRTRNIIAWFENQFKLELPKSSGVNMYYCTCLSYHAVCSKCMDYLYNKILQALIFVQGNSVYKRQAILNFLVF
jgi:hypothetical protein